MRYSDNTDAGNIMKVCHHMLVMLFGVICIVGCSDSDDTIKVVDCIYYNHIVEKYTPDTKTVLPYLLDMSANRVFLTDAGAEISDALERECGLLVDDFGFYETTTVNDPQSFVYYPKGKVQLHNNVGWVAVNEMKNVNKYRVVVLIEYDSYRNNYKIDTGPYEPANLEADILVGYALAGEDVGSLVDYDNKWKYRRAGVISLFLKDIKNLLERNYQFTPTSQGYVSAYSWFLTQAFLHEMLHVAQPRELTGDPMLRDPDYHEHYPEEFLSCKCCVGYYLQDRGLYLDSQTNDWSWSPVTCNVGAACGEPFKFTPTHRWYCCHHGRSIYYGLSDGIDIPKPDN